jgi:hypothetical protein
MLIKMDGQMEVSRKLKINSNVLFGGDSIVKRNGAELCLEYFLIKLQMP